MRPIRTASRGRGRARRARRPAACGCVSTPRSSGSARSRSAPSPAQGSFPRILPATPAARRAPVAHRRARHGALAASAPRCAPRASCASAASAPTTRALPVTTTNVGARLRVGRHRAPDRSQPPRAPDVRRRGGRERDDPAAGVALVRRPAQRARATSFTSSPPVAGLSQRVEWRTPVPVPSVSLGRFGRVPGQATLAPFVQGTFIRRAQDTELAHPSGGYPSAGVALVPFFDLLRIEVARGLRGGRWTLNVDVAREFWGVL